MKNLNYFDSFLVDTVNLNATRLERLEASVGAIKRFINGSDWTPNVRGYLEQGSWAHRTIIKPVANKAFDADLLVLVDPVDGWTPGDYINTLATTFRGSNVYKEMVRSWDHCVTIEYAGDYKIDIAPCIVNRSGLIRLEVCSRTSGEFERTEPQKYTQWLLERDRWAGGNRLRKVTRLLKYLRDIKSSMVREGFDTAGR